MRHIGSRAHRCPGGRLGVELQRPCHRTFVRGDGVVVLGAIAPLLVQQRQQGIELGRGHGRGAFYGGVGQDEVVWRAVGIRCGQRKG